MRGVCQQSGTAVLSSMRVLRKRLKASASLVTVAPVSALSVVNPRVMRASARSFRGAFVL